jgi:chromosome segregation ATPase
MKQLNDSIPKSEADDINALKSLVKRLEAENAQLKSKFSKLFHAIGQRKDDKKEDNEDELIANIAQKDAQITKLLEDNKKLFNDNRSLNGVVRKFKEQLDAALKNKARESENAKIVEENKSLRQQLSTLESRLVTLQRDFDRLGKMSVEFMKTKKDFETVSKERDELLKRVEDLKDLTERNQKLLSDNGKLFQDNRHISSQLAKVSIENADLKKKVEEARGFASKFRAEIDELRKTITSLNVRLEISGRQQGNRDDLRRQISEFRGVITMLEKRIEAFEAEKRDFNTQIESLRKETTTLKETINNQNTQIEDWRRRCTPAQNNPTPSRNNSAPARNNSAPARNNSTPAITLPPIFNLPNIPQRNNESGRNPRNTFIGSSLQSQDFE